MKTTTQVENAVIAIASKGLDFEAYTNIESRDTFIGIKETKKFVWDWFKAHTYYVDGIVSMDFDHSYSQNTGRTKKSVMHRINTRAKYENLLGLELSF